MLLTFLDNIEKTADFNRKKIASTSSSSPASASASTSTIATFSSQFNLMKSQEFKKCEQKLNSTYRTIKQKEQEKASILTELEKKKTQLKVISIDIRASGKNRKKIYDEINEIKTQLDKSMHEMNRIKADLLYKTRKEYEDMIRRFENEMQTNLAYHRPEESRLLNDIKLHKQGIAKLEDYEKKKVIYDNLKEKFATKTQERDENWKHVDECKHSLNILNEEVKIMTGQIDVLNIELAELMNTKVELKKNLEDLARENLVRQQQLKKSRASKQLKQDEIVVAMEETIRDYNKLINYFQRFLVHDEFPNEVLLNTPNSNPNRTLLSPSLSSPILSLNSSLNNQQIQQLFQNSSNEKNNYDSDQKSDSSSHDTVQSAQTRTRPPLPKTLSVSSSFYISDSYSSANTPYTPTNPICLKTPNDDSTYGPGSFVMKKKLDDEPTSKRRFSRKFKSNKTIKFSHTADIINLLTKLNIPLELSYQIEECLRKLQTNRDSVQEELDLYKSTQMNALKSSSNSIDGEKGASKISDVLSPVSSINENLSQLGFDQNNKTERDKLNPNTDRNIINNRISDTVSEISSCLDSNYESDNNSVRSMQSNSLINYLHAANKPSISDVFNIDCMNLSTTSTTITGANIDKTVNKSTAINTNSDDSDVTVNELTLNEKDSNLLTVKFLNDLKTNTKQGIINTSIKLKKSKNSASSGGGGGGSSSSSNSDSTLTPASPKTPTNYNFSLLNTTDSVTSKKFTSESNDSEPKVLFSRQLSDGYSSSCTPLSACSINNEQNPFFKTEKTDNDQSPKTDVVLASNSDT